MKRHTKIAIAVGAIALVGVAGVATVTQAHRSHHGEYGYSHGGYGFHGQGRHGGHHGGRHGGAMMMERFDLNEDGQITREEIVQVRDEKLKQFDADQSGSLSLNEFEGLWLDIVRERMVDRFQKLDGDGDGEVTQSEIDKRLSRMVERMDRNEDGVIDKNDRRRHRRDDDRDSKDDD